MINKKYIIVSAIIMLSACSPVQDDYHARELARTFKDHHNGYPYIVILPEQEGKYLCAHEGKVRKIDAEERERLIEKYDLN